MTPINPADPNARARAIVRGALREAGLDATDRLLDVLVDAVLAGGTRDEAIADVLGYTSLKRGDAAKLVDLAIEALTDGGHL